MALYTKSTRALTFENSHSGDNLTPPKGKWALSLPSDDNKMRRKWYAVRDTGRYIRIYMYGRYIRICVYAYNAHNTAHMHTYLHVCM